MSYTSTFIIIARSVDNLATSMCRFSGNFGSLNLLETSGPLLACNGVVLPFSVVLKMLPFHMAGFCDRFMPCCSAVHFVIIVAVADARIYVHILVLRLSFLWDMMLQYGGSQLSRNCGTYQSVYTSSYNRQQKPSEQIIGMLLTSCKSHCCISLMAD